MRSSSRWSSRRSSSSTSRTTSGNDERRRVAPRREAPPGGQRSGAAASVGGCLNLRGKRTREDPEINFIPLIDVLLVILIFLMVTTTYQRIAELQITLPEANADPAKQRPREINVGIDPQGRYKIDREPAFTF